MRVDARASSKGNGRPARSGRHQVIVGAKRGDRSFPILSPGRTCHPTFVIAGSESLYFFAAFFGSGCAMIAENFAKSKGL